MRKHALCLVNVYFLYEGRIIKFSPKELKIIFFLLLGYGARDVAAFLKNSSNYIHCQLSKINKHLNVSSCYQAGRIFSNILPEFFLIEHLPKIKLLSQCCDSAKHFFSYGCKKIKLTNNDLKISSLLIAGLKPKEMAENLCLSISTVYGYIAKINRKFGFENKYQAGSVLTKIIQEMLDAKEECGALRLI